MYKVHMANTAWNMAEKLFPESYPSMKYTADGMVLEVTLGEKDMEALREKLVSYNKKFSDWKLIKRK